MNKKQDNADSSGEVTVEMPEFDEIFNFDKEAECWKGQYIDNENKVLYERWPTVEETKWNNFRAKCIDINSGKWFTDGESSGIPKGKQGPKRLVSSIIRLKSSTDAEYLLSNSKIIAYDAHGDIQKTTANLPEKYNKTIFRFETLPDFEKGVAQRRNTGPSGSELIYTLPFTKENAEKLFDLRENNQIQFIVKQEDRDSVYEVKKPNATLQENFKMFAESDFEYLFTANYISRTQKIINSRLAENEGLIPKMTDDERTVQY